MPEITFSVIIPLYNKASYVAKAIGSVLQQTCTDFELVVVDDGSTDGSDAVAEAALGDSRALLLRQENCGVSIARNRGVAESRGRYLCFLDADDWWDPSFLEQMLGLVARHPQAGIYGSSYIIVNSSKHKTRPAPIGVEKGFAEGEINYFQVYAGTMAMPLWTGAVCVPRAVFNAMGGFAPELTFGEDFHLWARIALQHKVVFLNKPLAYYNQDADPRWRGVGRLHPPEHNFLFHLPEAGNPDYCHLADLLRAEGLLSYMAVGRYRAAAQAELSKVSPSALTLHQQRLYRMPAWLLRCRNELLRFGSEAKTCLKNLLYGKNE